MRRRVSGLDRVLSDVLVLVGLAFFLGCLLSAFVNYSLKPYVFITTLGITIVLLFYVVYVLIKANPLLKLQKDKKEAF